MLTAALVGHTGRSSEDDVVIDETIGDDQYSDYSEEQFSVDVDEGQTITIVVETEEDTTIWFFVDGPEENILKEEVSTEETFTLEAEKSGTYTFDLGTSPYPDGRGSLTVVLE